MSRKPRDNRGQSASREHVKKLLETQYSVADITKGIFQPILTMISSLETYILKTCRNEHQGMQMKDLIVSVIFQLFLRWHNQ